MSNVDNTDLNSTQGTAFKDIGKLLNGECTQECSEQHTYVRGECAAYNRAFKPSWDAYFLGIAVAVATRSGCVRANVGAVIVSPDLIIQSTGYNDAPPGQPGCEACPHRTSEAPPGTSAHTFCSAVHAEQNAIIYAGRSRTRNATIYVTTRPCDWCLKLIKAAGIIRIVCPDYKQDIKQPFAPQQQGGMTT